MKLNKTIIAGVFASAFMLSSCGDDFLTVIKPDGDPLEEYYVTDERLNESLTAAYAPLHWPDWDNSAYNDLTVDAEIMGDDFWVGGQHNADNLHWHKLFNFDADGNNTLATLWGDFYSGIKRCNDCIKYCSWNPDLKNSKSYELQARLLRVYYYNILWHYYGNVPFYLENLSMPYTAPQLTADEIYNQLLPELEDIINADVLPMRWPDNESGRVSKAFAYMLYAEMTMYQNDTQRYPQALAYMKEIIKSDDYNLHPDFAEIWLESGEWCEESIFEINYNDAQGQRDWGDAALNAGGSVLPTLISPNSWTGDEGWNGLEGWGFLPVRQETYDMFTNNGDIIRRDATIWDVRDKRDKYTPRYQDTGLWLGKYRPLDSSVANSTSSKNLNYNNNKRVYRYAETLLNAAELIIETGGDRSEATNYLNQVRNRVNMPAVSQATIDNIIDERHYEFCGEGKRYFDLVRTGKAAEYLKPDSYGYRTNTWSPSKKHIPLAQSEIDADPTLKQNDY